MKPHAVIHIAIILSILDIVIPGTNTSTDVQARISAGESIHIIRGTKGNWDSLLLQILPCKMGWGWTSFFSFSSIFLLYSIISCSKSEMPLGKSPYNKEVPHGFLPQINIFWSIDFLSSDRPHSGLVFDHTFVHYWPVLI